MILIWFNPNNESYYQRILKGFYSDYCLGYENSYGHILVQIFIIRDKKIISINSYSSYLDIYFYNDLYNKSIKRKCLKKILNFFDKFFCY